MLRLTFTGALPFKTLSLAAVCCMYAHFSSAGGGGNTCVASSVVATLDDAPSAHGVGVRRSWRVDRQVVNEWDHLAEQDKTSLAAPSVLPSVLHDICR